MRNHNRFISVFRAAVVLSLCVILAGLIIDGPKDVLRGLLLIVKQQDLLITDYVYLAGIGAALANMGLVTLASVALIRFSGDPFNGYTLVELGLMAGFALFGKNIFNIWPIILGTWLYARWKRRPFARYASIALLATSLAPLVSYMALGSSHASLALGVAVGVLIGFILPPLSVYTYKLQNGLSLYNMGFASGLLAMMIVPILAAAGDSPETVLYWTEGFDRRLLTLLLLLCAGAVAGGSFFAGKKPGEAWRAYRRLLRTSGRMPSDYLRMFGYAPTLINIGVNGLVGLGYLAVVGGDLNGPTFGAVLTIMGFSATGKNTRNIVPVMTGVALSSFLLHKSPGEPSLQLAGLFCTTLAPLSGQFGWPFGLAAGFVHSALVLQTAGPVSGMNLYNNGFSGGLIAIVFYPIIVSVFKRLYPKVTDSDYFVLFDSDEPMKVEFEEEPEE